MAFLKFFVNNLGRGFLYTIGRVLAFIFLGLVIATLLTKIDIDKIDIKPLIKEVKNV